MSDFASLKKDKIYVEKLKALPLDLSKLSNAVRHDVVKKTVYDEFFKKVNAIQAINTSNLVEKSEYNTKIEEIEKKILNHDKYITTNLGDKNNIADFVKKIDFDEKIKKKK